KANRPVDCGHRRGRQTLTLLPAHLSASAARASRTTGPPIHCHFSRAQGPRRPEVETTQQVRTVTTSAKLRPARSAGILLHPTSLPGPYGIGDLGTAAYTW